ncbi:hypothetical protein YC2023_025097 [Brassica napus]
MKSMKVTLNRRNEVKAERIKLNHHKCIGIGTLSSAYVELVSTKGTTSIMIYAYPPSVQCAHVQNLELLGELTFVSFTAKNESPSRRSFLSRTTS